MLSDPWQLRAAVGSHRREVEEERGGADRAIDGQMPDVVPRVERKVPGERGVEQPVEPGGSEYEHAEHAAEDGEVQVAAPRERAALVIGQPALRRPPGECPRGRADEDKRDVRGRL